LRRRDGDSTGRDQAGDATWSEEGLAMIERTVGAAVIGLLGLVGGCAGDDKAELYYPLAAGRTWTYAMRIRQGVESDARTVEASSTVTNLPAGTFDGSAVTPQQTLAFGQTQTRLMRVSTEGVAEVATQPEPPAKAIPRIPPNVVLRRPLQVGAHWQSTWQSNQLARTTLVPMTKTVTRVDGRITLPAGEFDRCLVVSIHGGGPVTAPGESVDVVVDGEEWFAPGVGLIRGSFREEVQGRPGNATRVELELTSFRR
jgi:hypothetical protein